MLAALRRWIAPEPRRDLSKPGIEAFGRPELPPAQGLDALRKTDCGLEDRRKIHEAFATFSQEEKSSLLDRPLARFALYVADLGASEANHDCGPYGLLGHSLRVALETVKLLRSPAFRASEDPLLEYTERPIWLYGGFLLALFHDAGKVFDLDILSPDKKELWNPLLEPLSTFLLRHGQSETTKETRRYHPGRGKKRHTWLAPLLAAKILPDRSVRFLGPRLPWLFDGYVRAQNFTKELSLQGAAGEVVRVVVQCDQEYSEASLASDRSAEREREVRGEDSETYSASGRASTAGLSDRGSSKKGEEPPRTESPAAPSRFPAKQGILERLSAAVGIAVKAELFSMNCPGALAFVMKNHLYLRYPDALTALAMILKDKWGEEDPAIRDLGSNKTPAQALHAILSEAKELAFFDESQFSPLPGTVLFPTGEREDTNFVLLAKDVIKEALPLFKGKIAVSSSSPTEEVVEPESTPEELSQSVEKSRDNEGASSPAPVVRTARRPRKTPSVTMAPLAPEMAAKLAGARVTAHLRGMLRYGKIDRNGPRALVFIQRPHTWLAYPEGLVHIAKALGVPCRSGLADFVLQELFKLDFVDPKELIHARVSPEAKEPSSLVRIETEGFLPEKDVQSLGIWEHELSPLRGDSAAWRILEGSSRGAVPEEREVG